jgi:tetratricopeptide (TPR) repeat protein
VNVFTGQGIFVSYRRADAPYAAGWLADRLTGRYGRSQVFKDITSIGPGAEWAAEIMAAVRSCAVLLAVIGPAWLTAEGPRGRRLDDPEDLVRLEIGTALARGVRVVPVLVDGARMPGAGDLPADLAGLAGRQAIQLRPDRFVLDAEDLLDALLPDALRPGPAAALPRQLPAHTPHFVGRAAELAELTSWLDEVTGRPGPARTAGPVVISAIGGMAGIGKTALALHWAHEVAGRFPDGQLYVNLRGFDPAGSPVAPAEAIRGFLDAFAVPPERIPAHLEAQAALYRSLIADRRMLVVLDNARDPDQLRPLLPGSEGCLVLITSRNQLAGLIAREGARLLTLDVLTGAEARELLARRLGRRRAAAEPAALNELIRLCARLPLALSIVAARATAQPRFPLAVLAAELRDARHRLDALKAGELAADAQAVFSWSYDQLAPSTARVFRLLGLHVGPDISLLAAASLAGLPPDRARAELTLLAEAHMITEQAPGRFAFHDLLRAYAASRAADTDTAAERQAASHRVLDHYLHAARAAAHLLYPDRHPIHADEPRPGVHLEGFADHRHALAWFDAERPALLAATGQAVGEHLDAYAWKIPWTLEIFLDRRGYWHDWAASQRIALAAAARLSDGDGQARAHRSLGRASSRLGLHEDGRTQLQQALALSEQSGDLVNQARTHLGLSVVLERQDKNRAALGHAQLALGIYRDLSDRPGQANALNSVGWLHARLGEPGEALAYCQEALSLLRDLGDRPGEAATCDSLGYAHSQLREFPQAFAWFESALSLYRELADRYYEADTLTHLGDARHEADDDKAARDAWQQARAILDDLHHPGAEQLRARLRELDGPAAPDRD